MIEVLPTDIVLNVIPPDYFVSGTPCPVTPKVDCHTDWGMKNTAHSDSENDFIQEEANCDVGEKSCRVGFFPRRHNLRAFLPANCAFAGRNKGGPGGTAARLHPPRGGGEVENRPSQGALGALAAFDRKTQFIILLQKKAKAFDELIMSSSCNVELSCRRGNWFVAYIVSLSFRRTGMGLRQFVQFEFRVRHLAEEENGPEVHVAQDLSFDLQSGAVDGVGFGDAVLQRHGIVWQQRWPRRLLGRLDTSFVHQWESAPFLL